MHENHTKDVVDFRLEIMKDCDKAVTPASNDFFRRGAGKLLGNQKMEIFHSIVTKSVFISDRSRPYINTMVSVLLGRVREPNSNDWENADGW